MLYIHTAEKNNIPMLYGDQLWASVVGKTAAIPYHSFNEKHYLAAIA